MVNKYYLEKLEYNQIINNLSNFAITYIGKDICNTLIPSNSKEVVKSLLAQTNEAVTLLYKNSSPSFFEIANIEMSLKSLESSTSLSAKALLDLANIFKQSYELKEYFNKDFITSSDFPILSSLFSELYTNKNVMEKIYSCIIDENTIDDKASNNLQNIRKKKRILEQSIRSNLNNFIHSVKYSKYIQEPIITIRNDRFVIPVKEEYRSQIKGFVHDISNAGSTVYIEPISIFELNNEINNLKIEEEIEIEKILQILSSLFFNYIDELKKDVNIIGMLDFIFAKAKYSKYIDGITPTINEEKYINLINAKHPLLNKDKVVPISLHLGISNIDKNDNTSVLLITGPNTGGKTVTLKTVGLLTCMACSGLNIPASPKSSIYVFDSIFADIGDNQSIADSLSTFSSHMLNIIDIIKHSTKDSLILVDELGSGTDPLEGANLAISILEYFLNIGSLVVATTHYQELKEYALVTKGFKNASVEFDINTLSPTYKLLLGIPGKSNAFEISRKLGLDEKIINMAKNRMSKKSIDIEELLKNIYDDKSQIEKEKEKIEAELNKISSLRKKLEFDYSKLEQEKNDLINDAKIEARNILLDAKEDANEIIKKISNNTNSKELNSIRNTLNEKISNMNTLNKVTSDNLNNNLSVEDIKPNKEVFITTLNQNGIILSEISKSNTVQVQIGMMKMTIDITFLQPAKKSLTAKKDFTNSNYNSISKSRTIKSEINVIGLNVEEAIFVIDKFLDDCSLAKLQTARIVHGKGTGKLRNGIHQFLKTNPHVKNFRLGTFGEGEMGVTVVELKK